MADEYDYARQQTGTYTLPPVGEGLHVLDGGGAGCEGGRAYPEEGYRAGPPRERFEQRRYYQGSRILGHPGPRGMVTSSRRGRQAVDDIAWDERPPHFADGSGNEHAHLYVDPAARGPPLYERVSPGFRQVDKFAAAPPAGGQPDPLFCMKVAILFIALVLVAMYVYVGGVEGRIRRELQLSLREALAARSAP